jgi:diaminopimelate decarboxylase
MLKYFDLNRPELHIGRFTALDLVSRYGTPLYVYDVEIMKYKYNVVKKSFQNVDIFYSLKANPSASIASFFCSLGSGAEIASGGELYLSLQAGFRPENIIFVGPGKTNPELEYAMKNDLYAVVIESLNELRRADNIAGALSKKIDVMIRVNTKSWTGASPEVMVGGPSKLGMVEEEVIEELSNIDLKNVNIIGIHVYNASQVLGEVSLIDAIEHTLDFACYCSEKLDFKLKCVDFGGGWGVPYKEGENELNVTWMQKKFSHILQEKSKTFDLKNVRFIFELGRYLVAESGVYLARVIDIKESRGKKYLITDGGMNQQVRPVFMNLNHPTLIVNKLNRKKREIVQIGGPLCTPFDMLGKDIQLPEADIGDVIGIFNSGAYSFSMSMLNFLSHPWPSEVLVIGNDSRLIRERGNFENLVGNEILIRL